MASTSPQPIDPRTAAIDTMSRDELLQEVHRLDSLINSPQVIGFIEAVKTEAAHQREQWGDDHDEMKGPEDWFWLIGFLSGKAIRPSISKEKRLHRIIAVAAVCLNWHRRESKRQPSIIPRPK